jgi:hypothetical protein
MNRIKKTLFTLNLGGTYAPEITELTYPFLALYADKIGADFRIIKERKFPGWPVTYEKLQCQELARESGCDWALYVDGDAFINPEAPDYTTLIPKDTVLHHGHDFSTLRWKVDEYFLRDGRNWSAANWLTLASDWCLDVWNPLEIPLAEALSNICPTPNEISLGLKPEHFIDDYTLSRNISRYGLKATTILDLHEKLGLRGAPFFFHQYTLTQQQKVAMLKDVIQKVTGGRPGEKDKYAHDRYESPDIEGWMSPTELQWLYERAKEMQNVVEVGSWKGRSTHALLSGCKGTVHAVDHFKGSLTERQTTHLEALVENVYTQFLANVGHFKNLKVIAEDSAIAASQFADRSVDMVFLDGDHSRSGCLADIKAWLPKTRLLLCGHDRTQEGVPDALADSKLPVQLGPGSIWIHKIR